MRIALGVLTLAIAAGLNVASDLIEAAGLEPTTWPRATGLVVVAGSFCCSLLDCLSPAVR